jgi:hypothetical protein
MLMKKQNAKEGQMAGEWRESNDDLGLNGLKSEVE